MCPVLGPRWQQVGLEQQKLVQHFVPILRNKFDGMKKRKKKNISERTWP
jgi:hypothetical protein